MTNKMMNWLLAPMMAAGIFTATTGQAAEVRAVSCSVTVDYLLNNVVRAPYQKDFVVMPGATFQDDFSTFTRFRFFDASTHLENGNTVVAISYYNDVGVFEAAELRTTLTLRGDSETISGATNYFTELGVVGDHTTRWSMTCQRFKQ